MKILPRLRSMRIIFPAIALLCVLGTGSSVAQSPISITPPKLSEPVHFEKQVLPILRKKCLACHATGNASGELSLETVTSILKGGDNGPAIVPRKSGESLLLQLAAHRQEPFMPPPDNDVAAENLTSSELGLLKLWIDEGASAGAASNTLSPSGWRPLPVVRRPAYAVALTPDGQYAACGRGNQIFVYHVATGALVTQLRDPALDSSASAAGTATTESMLQGRAHLDLVHALTFNAQGDMLASGGFREIKFWRRPSDVRQRTFPAQQPVVAMAAHAGSDLLATAAADHKIQIWKLSDGAAAGELSGHTDAVTGLAFSADGTRLISGSVDKSLRVWDLQERKLLGRIDTPVPVAAFATFSQKPAANPNPPAAAVAEDAARVERLASGGGDNLMRVWRLPELPRELEGVPAGVKRIAVSPDRQWIALASDQGEVSIRSLSDDKVLRTWKAHEGPVSSLAFRPAEPPAAGAPQPPAGSPPGPSTMLATAGADQVVRLWNLADGTVATEFRGGRAAATAAAFRGDSRQLLTAAADGTATLWNLDLAPPQNIAPADAFKPGRVTAITRDRKVLAVGGRWQDRPAILVRDLSTGATLRTFLGHEAAVSSLAFNSDGSRLASGAEDRSVRVWDLKDEKFPEVARFSGHEGTVSGVAFHPNGQQVVSGGADNSVRLWNVTDEQSLQVFAGHTGAVVAVGFNAAGQPISASADKSVRIWNPANGALVRNIPLTAPASAMATTVDGARIAVALADRQVQLYQTADGAALKLLTGHAADVIALDFNADGTRLASSDQQEWIAWSTVDGRLLQIEPIAGGLAGVAYGAAPDLVVASLSSGGLQTQKLGFAQALAGMTKSATAAAFSSNDQLALLAGEDGTIRGFNVNNGQQSFSANHGAPVRALAVSPDGQRMASGGDDKQVKFWSVGNGQALNVPAPMVFAQPVQALGYSGDGRRLLAAASGAEGEGEVRSLDPLTGAWLESIGDPSQRVVSLAMAGDQHDVTLTVSAQGVVRRATLTFEKSLPGHNQPITALAAYPALPEPANAPPQVATGCSDGVLRHWNVETGQLLRQFNQGSPITAIAVRGDGARFAAAGANNIVRLWNINGQQIAELRGDLRALAAVAKLTQEKTAATARVQATTAQVAEAEKDLPVKRDVAAKAAAALATANADVAAKQAALNTAVVAKVAAEKIAIEAASVSQKAALAKAAADQQVVASQAVLKEATDKLAQAQAAAQAATGSPNAAALTQGVMAAQTVMAMADSKLKADMTDAAAKAKAAVDSAAAAGDAATKAAAASKPAADAATALLTSTTAQKAAAQASAVADRDAQAAAELVPVAKAELTAAEALLKDLDARLTAAQQTATAAEKPARAMVFSPDGRRLSTGGDLGIVHNWDAETGRAVSSQVGHEGPIHALAYLSDDALVSGSADKSAGLWDLNPGWVLQSAIGSVDDPSTLVNRVTSLAFRSDGTWIAAGGGEPSRGGELKVFNVADGKLVCAVPDAHTDEIYGVAFSPDGSRIASAGADKFIRLFALPKGEPLRRLEGHTDQVLSVAWRADGRVLASAGADRTQRIWNPDTGDRLQQIENYTKQVSSVRFIGQSPNTVSCSGDGSIRMVNSDNGQNFRNLAAGGEFLYSVDATPDGRIVVTGGFDGALRIFNGENGQLLHTLQPVKDAAGK